MPAVHVPRHVVPQVWAPYLGGVFWACCACCACCVGGLYNCAPPSFGLLQLLCGAVGGLLCLYKATQPSRGPVTPKSTPTPPIHSPTPAPIHTPHTHCRRTEMMDHSVAERCVELMEASAPQIATVDITGGAPELMPQFR